MEFCGVVCGVEEKKKRMCESWDFDDAMEAEKEKDV